MSPEEHMDRQEQADRQRFLDKAAIQNHAAILAGPCDSAYHNNIAANAYAEAEALWTERQKRIDEQHARGRK
jgi:hypothetical protein